MSHTHTHNTKYKFITVSILASFSLQPFLYRGNPKFSTSHLLYNLSCETLIDFLLSINFISFSSLCSSLLHSSTKNEKRTYQARN